MMGSMSRVRTAWIALTISAAVLAVLGLVAIVTFLVPKTLDDADKWSSVYAGLLAYLAVAGGVIVWLARRAFSAGTNGAENKVEGEPTAGTSGGPFGYQVPAVRHTGPVRDADPRLLGVHRPVQVDGAVTEWPPYIERDTDHDPNGLRVKIGRASQRNGLIVLVGGSSVGKSRSAYEGVRTLLPDWRLVHPSPDRADWIDFLTSTGLTDTVVWLDELQRYLDGPSPLTADLVRTVLRGGRHVVLLGTLWPERYNTYVAAPGKGHFDDPWRRERELLELADIIHIPDVFSGEEQARASDHARTDPRIGLALQYRQYGLTQTIAAAPQLVERWRNSDVYAAAVLNAAIDVGRLGAQSPVPVEFLHAAATAYCDSRARADAPADWFDAAIKYCTQPLYGAASALEPAGTEMGQVEGYIVADYLQQYVARERHYEAVPVGVWQAAATRLRQPDDLYRIGVNAEMRLRYCYAVPLFTAAARMGHWRAAFNLADLAAKQGQLDTATTYYQALADHGHEYARLSLVDVMLEHGRLDDVRRLADDGYDYAAIALAGKLQTIGRGDEALAMLQSYLDVGRDVSGTMAELLEKQGQPDQAIELLRRTRGSGENTSQLARLLARYEHEEELREMVAARDVYAAGQLAQMLVDNGRWDDLRELAERGGDRAAFELAQRLRDLGEYEDADAILQKLESDAADAQGNSAESVTRRVIGAFVPMLRGTLTARKHLDRVSAKKEDVDKASATAEAHLRAVQEYGTLRDAERASAELATRTKRRAGRWRLVKRLHVGIRAGLDAATTSSYLPVDPDRIGEVMPALEKRADSGDQIARVLLIDQMLQHGRIDEVHRQADAGQSAPILRLADFIRRRDGVDAASRYLRERVDAGSSVAGLRLVDLLSEHGRHAELEELASGGDVFAARRVTDPGADLASVVDAEFAAVGEMIREFRTLVDGATASIRPTAEPEHVAELRHRADSGDGEAARQLAGILAAQGRLDDLRARVDVGDPHAGYELVQLMRRKGQEHEADQLDRFGFDTNARIATAAAF
jgi:tetratricopeptide (TPR) repeat protein